MNLLILTPLLFTVTESWQVLIANPFAGGSHQSVSIYLANVLARNSHQVTYLSTNMPKQLHKEVVKLDLPRSAEVANTVMDSSAEKQTKGVTRTWSQRFEAFTEISKFCQYFYEEPNVQTLMKSGKRYDLLVAFGALDGCAMSLGRYLEINNTVLHLPGPFLLPAHITQLGIPLYSSSHYVHKFRLADSTPLRESMLTRAGHVVSQFGVGIVASLFFQYTTDTVAYKHVPAYTGYKDLYSTVRLIFMHYHPHPLVDTPLPMGPGVINLGGSTCDLAYNPDHIPADTREFVDSSPGFILISFGSHVQSLREEEVELWVKVFSTLPYSVVWRLVGHTTLLPDYIRTYKWLPQRALLKHPKIKMFISHGGYGSKIESTCAGVPLLFVPRFAEQFETAQQCSDLGTAEQVLMKPGETTAEEITRKIRRTLEVHSRRIKEVSRQLLQTRVTDDQVLGYLDMAVSGHRLLPGYQPWWQYFYLDLIVVPAVVIMIATYLIRKFKS
ncbi:hypothetical protein ACHWQZ_G005802 [Mnemiopsis leidyi]